VGIEKKPFVNYTLDEDLKEKPDIFTIRLNKEERLFLNEQKRILEQPKDSTALKTLALIGAKVIHEEKIAYIIDTLFKNKKNNERSGHKVIE